LPLDKPSLGFLHAADEHLREKVTLSLYVPTEQVGIVIGKKGAKIKYIQDASMARVNVEPTKDGVDSAWSLVTVRGNPSGCLTAARVIARLVEELDECVAQFPVPKSRQDQVIGRGGATIRRISADTNVRIHVPGRKDEGSNDVQLEGEVDAVFKAVVEVVEAVYSGGGDRSSHAESDGQEAGQGMKEGGATTPVAAASPTTSKEPPSPVIEETMSVPIAQLKVLTQGSTSSAMVLISRHTGTRIKKEPKPRKEKENDGVALEGDKSETKDEDEEEVDDEGGGEGGGGAAAQSTSSVSSGGAEENGGGGDGGAEADVGVPSSTPKAGEQEAQEEKLVKILVTGTDEKAVLAAVAALREVGEKQASLTEVIERLKIEFPAFRSSRPKSGGGSGRGGWKSGEWGGSRGNKRGGGGGGGGNSRPRGGGGVNGGAGAGGCAAPST